jgi:hypothetical protein
VFDPVLLWQADQMVSAAHAMRFHGQFVMLRFMIVQQVFPSVEWNAFAYRVEMFVLF